MVKGGDRVYNKSRWHSLERGNQLMKRSIDQPLIVGALLVVGLLLAACGGSPTATMVPPAGATATATPAATAPGSSPTTAVEPSATQAPPPAATDTPVPSATPAPTSPPQPTATQQPTATSQPAAERISFAAGATSATVEGSLVAQGTLRELAGKGVHTEDGDLSLEDIYMRYFKEG